VTKLLQKIESANLNQHCFSQGTWLQ